MEDLDKEFKKKFPYSVCFQPDTGNPNEQWIPINKNIKAFIRQREKDLLGEVIEKIRAYEISGELPEEEQRINALLEEIIEDDIQPLKKKVEDLSNE